jgi:hypothetical protein
MVAMARETRRYCMSRREPLEGARPITGIMNRGWMTFERAKTPTAVTAPEMTDATGSAAAE